MFVVLSCKVTCILRHGSASDAHRHTHIRRLQRRRVVHSIARHRNDMPRRSQGFHDGHLVRTQSHEASATTGNTGIAASIAASLRSVRTLRT